MKSNVMYVVIAYRWGDRANHSYTLVVFKKKHAAITCAESHTTYRGGKYGCAVEKCVVDEFDNDDDDYTTEVYKTKSAMCRK